MDDEDGEEEGRYHVDVVVLEALHYVAHCLVQVHDQVEVDGGNPSLVEIGQEGNREVRDRAHQYLTLQEVPRREADCFLIALSLLETLKLILNAEVN